MVMNRYKKQMPIDSYEDMDLRLQGWGFDMEALYESEINEVLND